MRLVLDDILLRKPEACDLGALYEQKNDPEVADLLGGFTTGYSRAQIEEWLERHRDTTDECIWVIASTADDTCLGHVGLYHIDHRVRCAEVGIMIGDKAWWGRGVGDKVTRTVVEYGWNYLNLRRIYLSVLASNERALALYTRLGFLEEGRLREAQFKRGSYLDVVMMALLRDEYKPHA